jgi:hypothetical protein
LWEDSLDALFPSEQKKHSVAHYSAKKRVCLDKNEVFQYSQGVRVLAMFLLSQPLQNMKAEVTVERLTNRETFIAMMNQSFLLDVLDIKRINRRMRALGCMVPKLPAYRLYMPRDYDLLPLARQKILDTVEDVKNV